MPVSDRFAKDYSSVNQADMPLYQRKEVFEPDRQLQVGFCFKRKLLEFRIELIVKLLGNPEVILSNSAHTLLFAFPARSAGLA